MSYSIYSAVIYPVEVHRVWGGGWLSSLVFHNFVGAAAIHMVGGLCALAGASMLGSRIWKYTLDDWGKIVKINAFPGHNLPLGCLGCFILWLSWYDFNGAVTTTVPDYGSVTGLFYRGG